jgi:cyclopropane fatty-acyl-phospholipid synthase-like methyltransferase
MDTTKIGLDITKIADANKSNWSVAHMMGASGYLDLFFDNTVAKYNKDKISKICEIGSGYGCLMNYLKNKPYDYTGFDLIPRFEDVVEVMGEDGCLSDEQIDEYSGKFNLVYSFNVFQHLGKQQIAKYIEQSYQLLNKNEYSIMILGICLNSQSFHYGQVIQLPTEEEFDNMIEGKFRKVLTTKSHYPNLM